MVSEATATSLASILLENIHESYMQIYAAKQAIALLNAKKYQPFIDAVNILEQTLSCSSSIV